MITKCIICNIDGEDFGSRPMYNKYTSEDPSGVSSGIKRHYSFLKCPNCGLWWVKDPDENYEKMYETEEYWWNYHKNRGWNSIDETPRIENDLKYSLWRLPEIQKFVTSGNVLEIGSSTGTMLKVLKDNGFNPFGVEPCSKVARQAMEYSKCPVFPNIKSVVLHDVVNWWAEKFDLVIALDVLEHLTDPVKHIKEWVDACGVGGIIMVECPTIACESAEKEGINWHMCIPTEHIYHYNENHVIQLFDRKGCEPLEVSNPWSTDRQRIFFRKN